MSFLAGVVSTLGALVVVLLGAVWWTQPQTRKGINTLVGLLASYVVVFLCGFIVARWALCP